MTAPFGDIPDPWVADHDERALPDPAATALDEAWPAPEQVRLVVGTEEGVGRLERGA